MLPLRPAFQRVLAARVGVRTMRTSAAARALEYPTTENMPRGTVTPGQSVDPQLGEYPAMPMQNQQFRPYSREWWDTQDRREFGETLHEQDDVLNMWSPDAYKVPGPYAARAFATALGVLGVFSWVVYHTSFQTPALRKTFPRDGLAAELGGPQVRVRTMAPCRTPACGNATTMDADKAGP